MGLRRIVTRVGPHIRAEVVFPAVLACIGGYVVITSGSLEQESRLFSFIAGIALVIFAGALLVRELFGGTLGIVEVATDPDQFSVEDFEHGAGTGQGERSLLVPLGWAVGFFGLITLAGFVVGVPVWSFGLLLRYRANIIIMVVLPVILWAGVDVLLGNALGIVLFEGVLFGDDLPRLF